MSAVPPLPPPRFEPAIGSPSLVVLSAAALVAGIAIVLATAAWVSRPTTFEAGAEFSFTHGPRERTSIARDWIAQDAAVHEHLETYGWNDRAAGVVRIPIERAMDLVSRDAADAAQKGSR